jgi:hypothetical protein
MVPELTQSNIALKKRETQASPDSLYSSFESIVNKKSSKLDYSQKYESLNKEVRNRKVLFLKININ